MASRAAQRLLAAVAAAVSLWQSAGAVSADCARPTSAEESDLQLLLSNFRRGGAAQARLTNVLDGRQRRYRGSLAPPYGSHCGGNLPCPPESRSVLLPAETSRGIPALTARAAAAWRNESWRELPVDEVGLALELLLSPVGLQNSARGGEGSRWFGVDTLQDPMDAAAIQAVLWDVRPDLVIEIGTECGGSSLFIATLLQLMARGGQKGGSAAKVVTYDILPPAERRCMASAALSERRRAHRALGSRRWERLVAEGWLEPRVADVTSAEERGRLERYAAAARRVMIIDDGDHFATPLITHFEVLAHLVTPGSVYLIQDTRLDRTCVLNAKLAKRAGTAMWRYCKDVIGAKGGPARALRYLQCESRLFRSSFDVDRSLEAWAFTAHPGGWLRRRGGTEGVAEEDWPRGLEPKPHLVRAASSAASGS